jgi:uncharacterized protein
MNDEKIDRAWAFTLPVSSLGTESAESTAGLHINNKGGIAMVTEGRAVRQSILLLLATRPGERVMRPDYGCWLHRLVFAPNDAGTAGLAMHYVREALERWEPRAVITRLNAGSDLNGTGNPEVLDIILEYRVQRTGWEDQLTLGYDLQQARLMSISH